MRFTQPSPTNPVILQAFSGTKDKPVIRSKRVTTQHKLEQAASQYEDKGFAIYAVMNSVLDSYEDDFPGKEDIAKRSSLFIDIDPTRHHPDGGKTAATDEEKATAAELRDEIKAALTAECWPTPSEVDSGNGFYLMYNIDIPNTQEIANTIKAFIHCLSAQFSNEHAHVDKGVHNANRIIRLPGYLNTKGSNTEDRPHRECKVISESSDIVTLEQIEAYIEKHEFAPEPCYIAPTGDTPTKKAQCLQRYLADHKLPTTMRIDEAKNRVFLDFAHCPFRGQCDANAAVVVYPHSEHYDSIGFHCFEGNCGSKKWKDLQDLIGKSFLTHMGGVDPKPKSKAIRVVNDPLKTVERLKRKYNRDGVPGIVSIAGAIHMFDGEKWFKPEKADLSQIVTDVFEQVALEYADWAVENLPKKEQKPVCPSSTSITSNIINSLRANIPLFFKDANQIPPQFYFGTYDWDAEDVRRCRNGDLNLRRYINGEKDYFRPQSPQLFTRQLIDCDFDPTKTECSEFQTFLDSLKFTPEEMSHYQQVMAYAAWPLGRRDKIVVLQGPRRAGKGTTQDLDVFLAGGDEIMHPVEFEDLTTENGLQSAYDCLILQIGEATCGTARMKKAVKRLKEFTGGGTIQVSGKWMIAKKVEPNFVVVIDTNERLTFVDASGAINGRTLLVEFRESYFGREDFELPKKLEAERTQILN